MSRFQVCHALAALLLLSGCPGEGTPPIGKDRGEVSFPDSGLSGDAFAPHDGDQLAADGISRADSAPCPVAVPAGAYKGTVAGMLTGTIVFHLATNAGGGLSFVEQGSKLVVDKSGGPVTYPLLLGSLACEVLHAALGRPPGTTGGTDLRGAIDGTFKAPDLFKGTWNLPGSTTGTFKATLSP